MQSAKRKTNMPDPFQQHFPWDDVAVAASRKVATERLPDSWGAWKGVGSASDSTRPVAPVSAPLVPADRSSAAASTLEQRMSQLEATLQDSVAFLRHEVTAAMAAAAEAAQAAQAAMAQVDTVSAQQARGPPSGMSALCSFCINEYAVAQIFQCL